MGATPCVLVNGGPVDMNSSHGALGSGNRANATIGRAIKLVLLNVGGAVCGGSESTTLGTPMKYTMCISENEDKCTSAGWNCYHVDKGFEKNDTVVTLLPVTSGPNQIVDFFSKDADTLVKLIAASLGSVYIANMPLINDCTIVVSPEHLDTLVKGGVESKKEFARRLWRECNANIAGSYRNIVQNKLIVDNKVPQAAAPLLGLLVGGSLELVGRAMNLVGMEPLKVIPKFTSEESFHIIVAGAPAGKFTSFMPGFGVGVPPMSTAHLSAPVSRKVAAPPTVIETTAVPYDEDESVIVDPMGESKVVKFRPTKRTGSLKIVGFMDISKPKGDQILDRIGELLRIKFPDVEIRRYRKETFSRRASKNLISQISRECDHVVGALAD